MDILANLREEHGTISSDSFAHLSEIAFQHLKESGHDEIVCGPITTGGLGRTEANIWRFAAVIMEFRRMHRRTWSQLAYEPELWRHQDLWLAEHPDEPYCRPILEEFYGPIFRAGVFHSAYFIPGWRSSKGACWEHETLSRLGVRIIDVSMPFVTRAEAYLAPAAGSAFALS